MISWTYSGALRRVDIFWEESGGPPVRPPSRKGLGSAMLSSQLGLAEVKLNFAETGVRCKLSIDGVEPLGARSMDVSSAPVRALPSMR